MTRAAQADGTSGDLELHGGSVNLDREESPKLPRPYELHCLLEISTEICTAASLLLVSGEVTRD